MTAPNLIIPGQPLRAGQVYGLAVKGMNVNTVIGPEGEGWTVAPISGVSAPDGWSVGMVVPIRDVDSLAIYKQALAAGAPSNGVIVFWVDMPAGAWQAWSSSQKLGVALSGMTERMANTLTGTLETASWVASYGIYVAAGVIVVGLVVALIFAVRS